jgi:hypothetical protein
MKSLIIIASLKVEEYEARVVKVDEKFRVDFRIEGDGIEWSMDAIYDEKNKALEELKKSISLLIEEAADFE